MIEINWDRFTTEPREHQKVGVRWLTTDADPARGRIIPRVYLLGDEVGAGKSKQIVDASQLLYEANITDHVVVVGPHAARGVWTDPRPELGEVAKHGWKSVPNDVQEYSSRFRTIRPHGKALTWIFTNYEFIRHGVVFNKRGRLISGSNLIPLLQYLEGKRFWLVCDEAWALADNHTSQWKSVNEIRQLAHRVTELNGTPVVDTPLDTFGQMKLLDPRILGIPYFSHFRARYAMLKPNVSFPLITGWQNLEELRAKIEPYVLRRLTRDCFDLPEELDPILLEVKLTEATWKIYRQMRDEMIAWCSADDASVASQAMVKGLRLAQITSGFLGGVVKMDESGFLDFGTQLAEHERLADTPAGVVREIGREKLEGTLAFLGRLNPIPNRVLIWSRFRPEIERTALAFGDGSSTEPRRAFKLYGAQKGGERQAAIDALNPDLEPGEPIVVVGSRGAGGAALNFSGASVEINMSYTFLLREYLQARGRTDRPGLRHRLQRVDVVATGPKGQRTVDHHVLAGLRSKQDIAQWTMATWRQKLLEE